MEVFDGALSIHLLVIGGEWGHKDIISIGHLWILWGPTCFVGGFFQAFNWHLFFHSIFWWA